VHEARPQRFLDQRPGIRKAVVLGAGQQVSWAKRTAAVVLGSRLGRLYRRRGSGEFYGTNADGEGEK
jgi:hypothetical protein